MRSLILCELRENALMGRFQAMRGCEQAPQASLDGVRAIAILPSRRLARCPKGTV